MSQINSNIKDDFQVVLVLSCFVGHPVCHTNNSDRSNNNSWKYQRLKRYRE